MISPRCGRWAAISGTYTHIARAAPETWWRRRLARAYADLATACQPMTVQVLESTLPRRTHFHAARPPIGLPCRSIPDILSGFSRRHGPPVTCPGRRLP